MPRIRQERRVYLLQCQRHVAILLEDSVRRRPASATRCYACNLVGSKLWQRALQVLEQGVAELGRSSYECVLVHGLHKRFDMYLLQWGIAIEVDGSQHFHGSFYGTPAAVQYAWDRQVDAICRQLGQRLVRLHYADEGEWASTVKAALRSQEVVTYTSSYGL
jgi:hypothetical protein